MNMTWNRTSDVLPPEGVVVDTISESGLEQSLVRKGSLWFFPDMSMYVYYRVIMWRQVSQ